MSNAAEGRPSRSAWKIATWVLIAGIGAAAVGVYALRDGMSYEVLLEDLSNRRVDEGRLYHSSIVHLDQSDYDKILGKAQLFALEAPRSKEAQRLQTLIDIGSDNLPRAAEQLLKLSKTDSKDPSILNDLGVVLMARGKSNTIDLFKALKYLEKSKELAPDAPAPRFNLALGYRNVALDKFFTEELAGYRRVETNPDWIKVLEPTVLQPADEKIEELRSALSAGDSETASRLIQEHETTYRRAAMDYFLNPRDLEGLDPAMEFVADRLAARYGDKTLAAILAPLRTPDRKRVNQSRAFVRQGILNYRQGRYTEGLRFYSEAQTLADSTNSIFDKLWVQLNRAAAVIRSEGPVYARGPLKSAIANARQADMKWLLGEALTTKGADNRTSESYLEHLDGLNEAVQAYTEVGASIDAVRALNFLSNAYLVAGNFESSLDRTYQALRLTEATDHVRLSQLYWLAGLAVYRLDFKDYAIEFEHQAVAQGELAQNPALAAGIYPYLAMIYAANRDYAEAARFLPVVEELRDRAEGPGERATLDLSINLLCGRIGIAMGDSDKAEKCLQRNVEILQAEGVTTSDLYSQTLIQLANLYSSQGRLDLARSYIGKAVEVVETNDLYLSAQEMRMSFENERRDLYDTAIAFEYEHDGKDAAWTYLQRYRSKLFLEFLKKMNPNVVRVQADVIARDKVQRMIPDDLQVVEYVMLNDGLLAWISSRDKFTSVKVPVDRTDLENKVARFLETIQGEGEYLPLAGELYKLLIEPLESELDPKRAIAIIPDQALHRLPFPALYSPKARSFFIEQFTLLESPNLTHLLSSVQSGAPSRDAVISFGAQADDTDATQELHQLEQFYDSIQRFNGPAALKPTFLEKMSMASVFHYAGHSQDAADPLRSSVLLDGDMEGPNSVSAAEISQRRMPSNSVVVLASCDSSVGNSRDGVGMRGLTSAFLIGGAGSVVGSLWRVEATSTSRLVLAFHKAFSKDMMSVARALQAAQVEYLKSQPPYFWSGFVVTGNTSALR